MTGHFINSVICIDKYPVSLVHYVMGVLLFYFITLIVILDINLNMISRYTNVGRAFDNFQLR